MPLSKIQTDIRRLLAAHPDPESYVAGSTPLNRDAPHYSGDIDVFHDREERVAEAAQGDHTRFSPPSTKRAMYSSVGTSRVLVIAAIKDWSSPLSPLKGSSESRTESSPTERVSEAYTRRMATAAQTKLSLEEFRYTYAEEKPYYEYWFGEAVQKTVPTVLHVLLVKILLDAIERAGYLSGPELEIRIDPDWQPKADVAGWLRIDGAYPTEPIEIVVEVLSPEDRMLRVLAKCRNYDRIGIRAVFVLDPQDRDAWRWSAGTKSLERVSILLLPNGNQISVANLWSELDGKLTASI